MAGDKSNDGNSVSDRIDVNEPHELRRWAKHFYVTEDKIKEAVKAVGPMVQDVQNYLSR